MSWGWRWSYRLHLGQLNLPISVGLTNLYAWYNVYEMFSQYWGMKDWTCWAAYSPLGIDKFIRNSCWPKGRLADGYWTCMASLGLCRAVAAAIVFRDLNVSLLGKKLQATYNQGENSDHVGFHTIVLHSFCSDFSYPKTQIILWLRPMMGSGRPTHNCTLKVSNNDHFLKFPFKLSYCPCHTVAWIKNVSLRDHKPHM